jgi:predicted nucleotidyltransferase
MESFAQCGARARLLRMVRSRYTTDMISREEIQAFVDEVVRLFRPAAVILFGSHAYGQPTKDSDVDLMIVMPHRGPSAAAATQIRLAVPRSFPLDLIVRSPTEVRRRLRMGDQFLRDVTSNGIILHESSRARVGR